MYRATPQFGGKFTLTSARRHLAFLRTLMLAFTFARVVLLAPEAAAASTRYPQGALRCLASLTEPKGLLICPEHRNGYCVKEVSTLQKEDCGRTSYFGDKWNSQTEKCEYRKCQDTCDESSWDFEFEGEVYERNRFCCTYNYCNGGEASPQRSILLRCIVAAVTLSLAVAHLREE